MKVLILTVTAGQGHNVTARALSDHFEQIGVETKILDTLYYINRLLGGTISKGYSFSVKSAKAIYKRMYAHWEKREENSYSNSVMRATSKLISKRLHQYIEDYQPDVIVFTHILAGMLLDILEERDMLHIKTVGVLTDYTFHPFWEEALRLDYIVTPNELFARKARAKGFYDNQVLPYGIPIHPKFEKTMDKTEARLRFGLYPDKRTVLLMGGSMGYGPLAKIVRNLDGADTDFQMIAVCGSNRRAKAAVDRIKTRKKLLTLGFSDEIDLLMDASDCIVTKPGGLTTSEALAKCLPMIIVNPIPGQEDRNREFLLNSGIAVASSKTCLPNELIQYLFDTPERLELMRRSSELIRRPDATRRICNFVKELSESEQKS